MRVCVNALSATAPSGQHVLFGHLRSLARWTTGEHDFHVLCCPRTKPARADFGSNVFWHDFRPATAGWFGRAAWEFHSLPGWMAAKGMDLYFTPTGTVLPRPPVPQVSLAQNPWCLTAAVTRTFRERCKAMVQRSAFRTAQRSADFMIYNSHHMRKLYENNAGGHVARRSAVVYQGIHDETFARAAATRDPHAKDRYTILCVSVMARWKNCETLLRAVRQLRDQQIPARLRLIGSWPDPAYRQEIEAEINRLQLTPCVTIEGHLPLDALHAAYRSARVYALLSRCESFGIPAIEAQAFGTPVVGSDSCAMPEIGGTGGMFVSPDDVGAATEALSRLLTDDEAWNDYAERAIQNSQRFRWEVCSRPLLQMFELNGDRRKREPEMNSHAGRRPAHAVPQ